MNFQKLKRKVNYIICELRSLTNRINNIEGNCCNEGDDKNYVEVVLGDSVNNTNPKRPIINLTDYYKKIILDNKFNILNNTILNGLNGKANKSLDNLTEDLQVPYLQFQTDKDGKVILNPTMSSFLTDPYDNGIPWYRPNFKSLALGHRLNSNRGIFNNSKSIVDILGPNLDSQLFINIKQGSSNPEYIQNGDSYYPRNLNLNNIKLGSTWKRIIDDETIYILDENGNKTYYENGTVKIFNRTFVYLLLESNGHEILRTDWEKVNMEKAKPKHIIDYKGSDGSEFENPRLTTSELGIEWIEKDSCCSGDPVPVEPEVIGSLNIVVNQDTNTATFSGITCSGNVEPQYFYTTINPISDSNDLIATTKVNTYPPGTYYGYVSCGDDLQGPTTFTIQESVEPNGPEGFIVIRPWSDGISFTVQGVSCEGESADYYYSTTDLGANPDINDLTPIGPSNSLTTPAPGIYYIYAECNGQFIGPGQFNRTDTTFSNVQLIRTGSRDNCQTGYMSDPTTETVYVIPAGTYTSTISQEDADAQAIADADANAQDYFNNNIVCVVDPDYSVPVLTPLHELRSIISVNDCSPPLTSTGSFQVNAIENFPIDSAVFRDGLILNEAGLYREVIYDFSGTGDVGGQNGTYSEYLIEINSSGIVTNKIQCN